MVDTVSFDTKSDRELLIVLASSFNTLAEQTTKLCRDVDHLQQVANSNKDKLQAHETQLIAVVKANADVAEKSTDTLQGVFKLLNYHTEKITELGVAHKILKWGMGIVATIITGVIIYYLTQLVNWGNYFSNIPKR